MKMGVTMISQEHDTREVARSIIVRISQEILEKERILLKTECPSYDDYLRKFRELTGLRKARDLTIETCRGLGFDGVGGPG